MRNLGAAVPALANVSKSTLSLAWAQDYGAWQASDLSTECSVGTLPNESAPLTCNPSISLKPYRAKKLFSVA